MEPLHQPDATGDSTLGQEALVVSVRSTMKELQQSVQDLCKTSLDKIIAICESSLLFSSLLQTLENQH